MTQDPHTTNPVIPAAPERSDRAPVVVRRQGTLSVLIGLGASMLSGLYLWRALDQGGTTSWVIGAVLAVLAMFHLTQWIDARTPLLVADATGVRLRLGNVWHGLLWQDVSRVTVRERQGMLRDGRVVVHPADEAALGGLSGRSRRRLAANTRLYGAPFALPLGLTTVSSTDDLGGSFEALAAGGTVVEVLEAAPAQQQAQPDAGDGDEPATRTDADTEPDTESDTEPVLGPGYEADAERDRAPGYGPADEQVATPGAGTPESEQAGEQASEQAGDPAVEQGSDVGWTTDEHPAWDAETGIATDADAGVAAGPAPRVRSRWLRWPWGQSTPQPEPGPGPEPEPMPEPEPTPEPAPSASPTAWADDEDEPGDGPEPAGPAEPDLDPGPVRPVRPVRRALRSDVTRSTSAAVRAPILGQLALREPVHDERSSDRGDREQRSGESAGRPRVPRPRGNMSLVLGETPPPVVPATSAEPQVSLPAETEPDPAADPVIGPVITEARELLGLSVDDLATRTRIRPHVIEAIEVDDFVPCAGDFYARGHLRALGRVLGVDPEPLVERYEERYASAPIDARRVFEAELAAGDAGPFRGAGHQNGPRWGGLVIAVLVLVLVWTLAGLFLGESGGDGGVDFTNGSAIVGSRLSSPPAAGDA